MLQRMRTAGLLWPTLLSLAGFAVLVSLGNWQMSRKAWKEEVIATVTSRAGAPALSAEAARDLRCRRAEDGLAQSCEYLRVRVKGSFDHSGERHVFAGPHGGEIGYWVFTPFVPAGAGEGAAGRARKPILVNRGFVPERLKSPSTRAAAQIAGETEIIAHVRTREQRSWFSGENDVAKNIYYVRDPGELGMPARPEGQDRGPVALLEGGPFYLELVEGAPPGGFPKPLAGKIELPNRHLEYALTWYGLALTLVGVFIAFARSRLARTASGAPA